MANARVGTRGAAAAPKPRGTNERGERTRARLLAAGLEVFGELTVEQLLQGVSPKAVAQRAGVTTGAFYNHFPDHAAFVRALLEYGLLRPPAEDYVATHTFEKWISYANAPETHLLDDFLEAVRYNFDLCIETIQTLEFVVTMWTRRRDPTVHELLKRRYKLFMDDYLVAEDLIRQRWNVKWREPFTMETGAAVMHALAEGAHIRHCLEPELVDSETYARGIMAIIAGLCEPDNGDEPDHFYDVLARQGVRDWDPGPGRPVQCPSNVVIDAAVALLATVDMDACSVDDIATRAGVTAGQVYAAWGSRSRLATAIVARLAEPLHGQLSFDLALPMPGVRALDRQLGRMTTMFVELARTRPALLQLALRGAVEHLGRPPADGGNLGQPLVAAIEAGQSDGTLTNDGDARTLARAIGSTIAAQALESRGASVDAILAFVRSVFVHGIATKRSDARRRA